MMLFKYFTCSRTLYIAQVSGCYPWKQLYLIAFVESSSRDRKGQSYPVEYYLEAVEEYSEGKIHKSEPEPGRYLARNLKADVIF